jgi:hypothetical protein
MINMLLIKKFLFFKFTFFSFFLILVFSQNVDAFSSNEYSIIARTITMNGTPTFDKPIIAETITLIGSPIFKAPVYAKTIKINENSTPIFQSVHAENIEGVNIKFMKQNFTYDFNDVTIYMPNNLLTTSPGIIKLEGSNKTWAPSNGYYYTPDNQIDVSGDSASIDNITIHGNLYAPAPNMNIALNIHTGVIHGGIIATHVSINSHKVNSNTGLTIKGSTSDGLNSYIVNQPKQNISQKKDHNTDSNSEESTFANSSLPFLGWYEGKTQNHPPGQTASEGYSRFLLYRDGNGHLKSDRETHESLDPNSPVEWKNTQDANYRANQKKLNIGSHNDGTSGLYLEGKLNDDGLKYEGKGYSVDYEYSQSRSVEYYFSYTYLGPSLSLKNIQITEGITQISIRNWIKKILPNSPIAINDSDISFSNYDSTVIQNLTVNNGHLQLSIAPGTIGIFSVDATFTPTNETKTFQIKILPQPTSPTLTISDFNNFKNTYFSYPNTNQLFQSYKKLIPISPSNDHLVQSFEELLSLPQISQEIEASKQGSISQINLIGGMISERISTLKTPSVNVDDTTDSFVTNKIKELYASTYSTILENQEKLNQAIENANIPFRLEHIIVLEAIDDWKDSHNLMHIPYTFLNQIYDHGFTATLLRTSDTTLVLRDDTIMPRDSTEYLFFDKPETITFQSNTLDADQHMYSLNLYLDETPLKNFSNYLSVQLNYNHNDPQTENLLRVIHTINPDISVTASHENMGGIYNSELERMIFSTNHFSIFFIQTGAKNINDNDILNTQWATSIINALASRGILASENNGPRTLNTFYISNESSVASDSGGNFNPSHNITRGETSAMIVNAFKLYNPNAKSNFNDVPISNPFYRHISSLYELGIVKGSNNFFNPDDIISRQDASILLVNAILLVYRDSISLVKNPHEILRPFGNHGVTDYAIKHVATMVALNILKGDPNGNLNPKDPLTKAQMSALTYQVLQLQKVQGLPFNGTPRIPNAT